MIKRILDAILIARQDATQIPAIASLAQGVEGLEDAQVDQLIQALGDFGDDLQDSELLAEPANRRESNRGRMDLILQPVIHHLALREIQVNQPLDQDQEGQGTAPKSAIERWSDLRLRSVETLYRLAPATSDLRNHLLRWLAASHQDDALELWTELICNDPPEHRLGIVLAFSPLMQPGFVPSESLLNPLLTRATGHSQIAPAVFDLFNFYFRNSRLDTHPAQQRATQLTELLGQLAGQLGKVEEGNIPGNFDAGQINRLVSDSVSLIVALCDTFALLEYEPAIPKLHQALQLRHRRVQTEAAAALAKLGDEMGKSALIKLAEQPVSRLRVMAYAEELGFTSEISLELQGEIAMAESHLAIWLSEPDQMGLAPSDIELVDNREMFWPSYEHPIQCYLFRYSYGTGKSAHSNIGICGPLTHAFAADLRHLSVEEMYAAFAGWQTVHNEVFQMSLSRARQVFANEVRRLESALGDGELENATIESIGSFFGELVLIASGQYEGEQGTVVVDSHDSSWFEGGNAQAPIDWQLAYSIWRGKQLLAKFNSTEQFE